MAKISMPKDERFHSCFFVILFLLYYITQLNFFCVIKNLMGTLFVIDYVYFELLIIHIAAAEMKKEANN